MRTEPSRLQYSQAWRIADVCYGLYLVIDLACGETCLANAGHPMPICVRGSFKSAEPFSDSAKPDPVLGMFEGTGYHDCLRKLKEGDKFLLFTDGLFEVENADGQFFEQKRLMEAVRKRATLGAEALCSGLIYEIQQFSKGDAFEDDVSIVATEVDHLIGNSG